MVLPQILYILRVLSISIPTPYLKTLLSLLHFFIWKGKKPRCTHTNLIKHRSVGGMELVNIQDNHWTSKLDQLKHWFTTKKDPLWLNIQKALSPTQDLTPLLWCDIWKPWNLSTLPPILAETLNAWRKKSGEYICQFVFHTVHWCSVSCLMHLCNV